MVDIVDPKIKLSENMVLACTEFGIAVAQEVAAKALEQRPSMTLREFILVMNDYVARARKEAGNIPHNG